MRSYKKDLCQAKASYLDQSNYFIIANFKFITVSETATLRDTLAPLGANFHVVKNSLLQIAAKSRSFPELGEYLKGPSAIITGGDSPSEVAKVLAAFQKEKNKLTFKVGILDQKLLTVEDIVMLSKLGNLDSMRAQLLGLLTTPLQQFMYVLTQAPVPGSSASNAAVAA